MPKLLSSLIVDTIPPSAITKTLTPGTDYRVVRKIPAISDEATVSSLEIETDTGRWIAVEKALDNATRIEGGSF
jgi:hypothetical protein